jgi:hypothetical protein
MNTRNSESNFGGFSKHVFRQTAFNTASNNFAAEVGVGFLGSWGF